MQGQLLTNDMMTLLHQVCPFSTLQVNSAVEFVVYQSVAPTLPQRWQQCGAGGEGLDARACCSWLVLTGLTCLSVLCSQ
jgi:hypothetical protein